MVNKISLRLSITEHGRSVPFREGSTVPSDVNLQTGEPVRNYVYVGFT